MRNTSFFSTRYFGYGSSSILLFVIYGRDGKA